MHPEAEPANRNRRKRALLITLMNIPPIVVAMDAGHAGVKGFPAKYRTDAGFQLVLRLGVAFGPDTFQLDVNFEEDGHHTVVVPYAAAHRIACDALKETHIYQLDAEIAQARHRLFTSPTRTLVH